MLLILLTILNSGIITTFNQVPYHIYKTIMMEVECKRSVSDGMENKTFICVLKYS